MSHKDKLLKKLAEIRAKQVGFDIVENEIKTFQDLETKANEVMHTGNVWAGAELVNAERLASDVLDMVPSYSALLPLLPGNHGSWLAQKEILPIVWEIGLFRGNSEWTDAPGADADGTLSNKLGTDKVTIEQGQFYAEIAISKRELNYSIVDLYKVVIEKLQKSAARTIDAFILNADNAETGNVNRDGFDFGTLTDAQKDAYYYLQWDNGVRKLGIANGLDLGALDEDDLLDLTEQLGQYAEDEENLLFITSNKVRNKIRKFDSYKNASVNGIGSTIEGRAVTQVWGIDMVTNRDNPALATSTGKVHNTTGNTTGQIQLLWKPAVQYWFGQDMDFAVRTIAGKGIILVVTFEFGFSIVSWKAGQDKTVATGYNITL